MLDEKGRLFGKVNIVDLLIIVVVIAAIAFIGIKFVMPHNEVATGDDIEMIIYVDNSKRFVVDQTVVGSPVHNDSDEVNLGVFEGCTTQPYYEPIDADNKKPNMVEIPERCVVELKIKAKGSIGDYGATIDGFLYGIGHTMVVSVGQCQFFGAVKSFSVVK